MYPMPPLPPLSPAPAPSLHFSVRNAEAMNNTQQIQLAGKLSSFSTALPGLNALAAQRADQAQITVEVTPQGDLGRIEKTGPGNTPRISQVARTYYETFSDFLYRLVQTS